MEYTTAAVAIVVIGALVIAYLINRVNSGQSSERMIKHQEFLKTLEPNHAVRMAEITANRDIEIAKVTKKEPEPTTVIQGEAHRIGND